VATAAIVTIGNELTSGDVVNTNGSWLARRLEALGLSVRLVASVPDELETIAALVREQAAVVDAVLVTGGLGGTPDDITREAVAAAFGLEQAEIADVANELRSRFTSDPEYVARWANLPVGCRPLANPRGGAPGFALENVYVLPGLPAEMEAMFETVADELATGRPIGAWRRRLRTTESRIVAVLEATADRYPSVLVGSYPSFSAVGPEVEVVLKSSDADALADAAAWVAEALAGVTD
jgi:molybdenum cofactor synthesis domain-containing protein